MLDLDAYLTRLKAQPELAELLAPLFDLIEQQAQRIEELEALLDQLKTQVRQLQARLDQNSANSHKPPSSDGFKKASPGLPRPRGRRQGGQPGHDGDTLRMSTAPDHTLRLLPTQCACGGSLDGIEGEVVERRQVVDLPEPRLEVTEYQRVQCACPACGRLVSGSFPETVPAPVQYGAGVRALSALLSVGYALSYEKISRLFGDLFGHEVNVATVVGAQEACFEALAPSQAAIQTALVGARVVHFDETGLRVEGRRHWLHTASDGGYTDLFVHPKRGGPAMAAGLLPRFTSDTTTRWAVHDCLASYFTFDGCAHAVCGAHLLRELRAVEEQGSRWARYMGMCLLTLYRMSDSGRQVIPEQAHAKALRLYRRLLDQADAEEPPPKQGARGRPRSSKGRNLLVRLRKHESAVLAFAFEAAVPFTNNQAERDVRPAKVKQKVSGCFRTWAGAQRYARIAGFLSTVRKQHRNALAELRSALGGQTFLTAPAAC